MLAEMRNSYSRKNISEMDSTKIENFIWRWAQQYFHPMRKKITTVFLRNPKKKWSKSFA